MTSEAENQLMFQQPVISLHAFEINQQFKMRIITNSHKSSKITMIHLDTFGESGG